MSSDGIKRNVSDIKDITSEAGIVASVIQNPELTFYSEQLKPNYFSDKDNAWIYYAVSELAKKGVEHIDSYNIINVLNMSKSGKKFVDEITPQAVDELIEISKMIARSSVEEYMILVNNVTDAAFRRDTVNKLVECENLCFDSPEKDIEQKIYNTLDNVMLKFSSTSNLPRYADVVDEYWNEIVIRQKSGMAGYPFKFPTLNQYATIESGELFVFGAMQKAGKSMMLLNCATDLLNKNLSVLYIDSELNTRLFTCRLISHLTGIEFNRVRSGAYTEEEYGKILSAISWIKTKNFTHIYMPMFDAQSIYTAAKKVKHTQGLDVIIVDYLKGSGEGDAWASYAELGRFTDIIKNRICGDMDVAGIAAAQATSTGRLADSAKIARNASTIAMLEDKTPEEIETDGIECGNKKLRIIYNRNGAQMNAGEYIDLNFEGNKIIYTEAKQHIEMAPF